MTNEEFDERVRLFEADLDELVELCFPHNKPVAEAKIRQIATIMRRWLVDGDLQRMLSPLQVGASFHVQDTDTVRRYVDQSGAFRYVLTAHVRMNGKPVRFIYDSALTPAEVEHEHFNARGKTLSLKKFLAQPRLYHDGRWFTTGEIIRFVANKLGGNHLDFNRSGEWEHLDRANTYFQYGGPALTQPPGNAELYARFEPSSQEVIGGAHVEIIAAAASFVQMEIDGEPVRRLAQKSSLRNELRKFLRRVPPITVVERK